MVLLLSDHSRGFGFVTLRISKTVILGKNNSLQLVTIIRFKRVCPVEYLQAYSYISSYNSVLECQEVFLSYQSPQKLVQWSTFTRWIIQVFWKSGLDTEILAHSTRSAVSAVAAVAGLSIACSHLHWGEMILRRLISVCTITALLQKQGMQWALDMQFSKTLQTCWLGWSPPKYNLRAACICMLFMVVQGEQMWWH